MSDLPSHASPILAPQPRPSAQYLQNWASLADSGTSTPGVPGALISPAFTPPSTPGLHSGSATPSRRHHDHEPTSIPVDSTLDDTTKTPKLVESLPRVECIVRARIPTVNGAEMFLHLYQNDTDNKEHLAIVFGNRIRSQSLDRVREGETEMDRMIRGAYVGRLRPGRTNSRIDPAAPTTTEALDRRKPTTSSSLTTVPEGGTISSPPILTAQSAIAGLTSIPTSLSTSIPVSSPSTSTTPPESKPPLVRIHSECYTGETAWSARCDCGEQLDEAARLMSLPSTLSTSPGGVIIYLRQEGRGIGLGEKLKAYNLQDMGADTVEANLLLRHPADARSYGLATAMLSDLGLGECSPASSCESEPPITSQTSTQTGPQDLPTEPKGIRLLTNNPDKVRAIEGPNREIRVRERVAMVPLSWKTGGKRGVKGVELEKYLQTKVGRMGHMIEE